MPQAELLTAQLQGVAVGKKGSCDVARHPINIDSDEEQSFQQILEEERSNVLRNLVQENEALRATLASLQEERRDPLRIPPLVPSPLSVFTEDSEPSALLPHPVQQCLTWEVLGLLEAALQRLQQPSPLRFADQQEEWDGELRSIGTHLVHCGRMLCAPADDDPDLMSPSGSDGDVTSLSVLLLSLAAARQWLFAHEEDIITPHVQATVSLWHSMCLSFHLLVHCTTVERVPRLPIN